MSPLKVGDRVHLNDHGLRGLYGRVQGYRYMKEVQTVITEVDDQVATNEGPVYMVRVADREIDTDTILFDYFFDKIKAPE